MTPSTESFRTPTTRPVSPLRRRATTRALFVSLIALLAACSDSKTNGDAEMDAATIDAMTSTDARVDAAHDGGSGDGSVVADATVADGSTVDGGVVVPPENTMAWVMSYFGPEQDLSADSLHLAYSVDGLHWSPLKAGASVYQPGEIGTNHIRDPFIFRKNDGTFVYIATDWTRNANPGYWSNPSPAVFVADSTDLITFTNPRLLTLNARSGPGGGPMHAWAPEAYYDPNRQQYAIVWSGNDTSDRNRIYVSYTTDFTTILSSTPEDGDALSDVLFDPGYSVIDATIVQANGYNYLFYKDETDGTGAPANLGKDIQIARSSGAGLTPGTFSRWDPDYITRGTAQTVRQATEGPLVIKDPTQSLWYMYADYYTNGGIFGCWSTTNLDADPSTWTKLTNTEYTLPAGVRHANTVRVTQAELDAMVLHYGVASLIRTTYSEGNPFYVAHSWFHGMITNLADRSDGQLQNDFLWRIAPGLADPSDPTLVSFESVGWPGRYLRIDSANPNRYPDCMNNPANRAEGLCAYGGLDMAANRNHLLWLDALVDSPTFRSDATFKRVPALNGNAAMRSFQWHGDATRYLRHIGYQMFAQPALTATDFTDASFTIE